MQIPSISGAADGGLAGAAQKQMGKDEFLRLLVAQLSNQDPLNPAKDTEFIAQLAQFSSLEQLMGLGEGMQNLALATVSAQSADTVGFIGKEVLAASDKVELGAEGGVELPWAVAPGAEAVALEIRNEAGEIVRTIELGAAEAGNHSTQWDGLDDDGDALAPGTYQVTVRATAADGTPVAAEAQVRGRVTGVTFEKGYPELRVGGLTVSLSAVREVNG